MTEFLDNPPPITHNLAAMNNPQFFDHENGPLVIFAHNGRGYVAKIEIETVLPEGLNDKQAADYLLEDYEDGIE